MRTPLTVAVCNELSWETIPPGRVEKLANGKRKQHYQHDFFNYSRLARSVSLFACPRYFVEDITVVTDVKGADGIVKVQLKTNTDIVDRAVKVEILDEASQIVAESEHTGGEKQELELRIKSARLWQPGNAYLYTLRIEIWDMDSMIDMYELPLGVRTVKVDKSKFLINDKPFYFTGFGKHEDSTLRGKGFDPVTMIHNFNLMARVLQRGNKKYTRATYPRTGCAEEGVREYFEPLVSLTRLLDPTRPICFTNMLHATVDTDRITDLFDVIALNRYYGWYTQTSDLEAAEKALQADLERWAAKYNKPIFMTEYGADAQAGLHAICDVPWSEEYQADFLEMFHRVFDLVESVVGEHVWSFADFQCTSTIMRVDGNKKGVFTRDRRPKSAAQVLKRRWKQGPRKVLALE
ncbi:glycoside hydrolase superfamily [Aspergillus insuetus]